MTIVDSRVAMELTNGMNLDLLMNRHVRHIFDRLNRHNPRRRGRRRPMANDCRFTTAQPDECRQGCAFQPNQTKFLEIHSYPFRIRLGKHLVGPPGIEPGTYGLGNRRSVQLSYDPTSELRCIIPNQPPKLNGRTGPHAKISESAGTRRSCRPSGCPRPRSVRRQRMSRPNPSRHRCRPASPRRSGSRPRTAGGCRRRDRSCPNR